MASVDDAFGGFYNSVVLSHMVSWIGSVAHDKKRKFHGNHGKRKIGIKYLWF